MATPPFGLLERDGELAALQGWARAAFAGAPRLVLISGEAGSGKTALLRSILATITQGRVRVVAVRALLQERSFPFGVAGRLLDTTASPPPLGESLAAALELSFQRLIAIAGRGPVVFAVDDLQWADVESLRLLNYAAGRLARRPVLLLGATRAPEPDDDSGLIEALLSEAEVLEPAPLTPAAVSSVLARATRQPVDAGFAVAAQRICGGNPFLLTELARALAQEDIPPRDRHRQQLEQLTPAAVTKSLATRLRGMDPELRSITAALAVLEQPVDLRTVAGVAGLAVQTVDRALEDLAGRGLLAAGGGPAFRHPLVQSVIRASLRPAEREATHRAAARVLRAGPVPDLDRIAGHLLQTEPAGDPAVAAALMSAGRAAIRRGALDAGTSYLGRAVAEPPPPEALGAALGAGGGAALARGDDAPALGFLGQAFTDATDAIERADIVGPLCVATANVGRPGEAARLVADVLATLPVTERERGLRLQAKLAWLDDLTPDTGVRTLQREQRFDSNPDHPRTHGDRLAFAGQADREMNLGSAPEAIRLALLALDEGGLLHEEGLSFPFYATAMILYYCGDLRSALETLQAGVDRAVELGTASGAVMANGFLAGPLVRQGELRRGGDLARAALDTQPAGSVPGTYLSAFAIEALRERGLVVEATALLSQRGYAGRIPASSSSLLLLSERSRLRLLAGDAPGALRDARDLNRRMASLGISSSVPRPAGLDESLALQALGRTAEAVDRVGQVLTEAVSFGSPLGIGTARAAAGLLTQAPEELDAAIVVLREVGAAVEVARALVWLGEVRSSLDQPADATRAFTAGLRAARVVGAAPLEIAAGTGLRRLGRTTRHLPRPMAGALTDTEKRVAVAAADGATNAEVARALTMGQRTVETHLARVFRKLDISRRTQLREALAGSWTNPPPETAKIRT